MFSILVIPSTGEYPGVEYICSGCDHMPLYKLWWLSAIVGVSHCWVLSRSWRAIWSPQAGTASSSSWTSTDLALHSYSPHECVRACLFQIGGWQWWHSHSCGWIVFPRSQHSPPHPWTDLGEMTSGLAATYSSLIPDRRRCLLAAVATWGRWGQSLQASLQRKIKEQAFFLLPFCVRILVSSSFLNC